MKEIHLYTQGRDPFRATYEGLTIVVHHTGAPPVVVADNDDPDPTPSVTFEPIELSGLSGPAIALQVMNPGGFPAELPRLHQPLGDVLDQLSAQPQIGQIRAIVSSRSGPINLNSLLRGLEMTSAPDVSLYVADPTDPSDG